MSKILQFLIISPIFMVDLVSAQAKTPNLFDAMVDRCSVCQQEESGIESLGQFEFPNAEEVDKVLCFDAAQTTIKKEVKKYKRCKRRAVNNFGPRKKIIKKKCGVNRVNELKYLKLQTDLQQDCGSFALASQELFINVSDDISIPVEVKFSQDFTSAPEEFKLQRGKACFGQYYKLRCNLGVEPKLPATGTLTCYVVEQVSTGQDTNLDVALVKAAGNSAIKFTEEYASPTTSVITFLEFMIDWTQTANFLMSQGLPPTEIDPEWKWLTFEIRATAQQVKNLALSGDIEKAVAQSINDENAKANYDQAQALKFPYGLLESNDSSSKSDYQELIPLASDYLGSLNWSATKADQCIWIRQF